jgi:phage terminase large subunit-like protein
MTRVEAYISDVETGKIQAGNYIKQAIFRYKADLKEYEFHQEEYTKCIEFIGLLMHYTGQFSGKHFELSDFQHFIIANIVGIYHRETNRRKYTMSYIEMARKNGKTAFMSALALYMLIADCAGAPEIVVCANTEKQAQIAFLMCHRFVKQLDKEENVFHINRGKKITFDSNFGQLYVIASNSKGLDGFNCSFAILDEYHAATDTGAKDVIQSSMAMRENPHLAIITTAGFDKTAPCYELRNQCIDILSGVSSDESIFAAIFEHDKEDNLFDPSVWIKSNPNLGVTVKTEWLTDQSNKMKAFKSEESGIKTKNFNIWVDSSNTWINDKYIIDAQKRFTDEIKSAIWNEDTIAYCGIDLASTGDLTGASFLVKSDEYYYFSNRYYLPSETVRKAPYNRDKYAKWVLAGFITETPGNVTDYDYILRDILAFGERCRIRKLFYDAYNATQFAINATAEGLNMVPYSQSLLSFNRPTKEMERLLLKQEVIIESNPVNTFCFRNVALKEDWNGNVKPIKTVNDANKIDGVIAMIMALAGYLSEPKYNYSGI